MNINNPTTFAAPNFTYTTSNTSGTSGAVRADDSLAIFSATAPTNIATSITSAATGDNAYGSREDHVHGVTAITTAATEAEMKAASSTTVFDTPGRTKYHPGVAKAWYRYDQAGDSLIANYNVSGVADTAAGRFTVSFDTDFDSGTVFTAATTCDLDAGGEALFSMVITYAAGSIVCRTENPSSTNTDSTENGGVCFGEQ